MREMKSSDGSILKVNYGPGPMEIKAEAGPIIWRQLGGSGCRMTEGGFEPVFNGEFKDSSHDCLTVAVGGFCELIVDTDGRTIAFGTGIGAGERD